MTPPAATADGDLHSRRVVFDTAEWHSRLEKLAQLRQALPVSVWPGDKVIAVAPLPDSVVEPRAANWTARSCF
jgi:hypothetical protein